MTYKHLHPVSQAPHPKAAVVMQFPGWWYRVLECLWRILDVLNKGDYIHAAEN